jgi:hypothetical protein
MATNTGSTSVKKMGMTSLTMNIHKLQGEVCAAKGSLEHVQLSGTLYPGRIHKLKPLPKDVETVLPS